MSAQHTPGPWERDDKGRTISSAKGPICECFSGPVGVEECDANERLIAAAPDLLNALESLRDRLENLVAVGAIPMPAELRATAPNQSVESMRDEVAAVITKATGAQA